MSDIQYFTEASLEDSFIYQVFNDSNSIMPRIIKCLKNGIILDKEYIEEQYLQLKKGRASSPLAGDVCDAFDNGLIQLLYTKTEKMPLSIPFIIRNDGGRPVATIFISSFANVDDTNTLNIPFKTLYILMEAAYVALSIQVNPDKLSKNMILMKICRDVYLSMITRILNRDFAISSDKILENKVYFTISKFFIKEIWGLTNEEVINNYAASACRDITEMDMMEISSAYDNANIKTIDDVLMFLKTISPRLVNINTKFFMERFINTYGQSAILSLDYLPYLFFVIINILLGGFIVSQNALSDLIKNTKNMNQFYRELSKLY